MLFGGMMVGKADISRLIGRFNSIANFIYCAKLLARYLVDRLKYQRGTRLMMGNALIGRLFYSLRQTQGANPVRRSDCRSHRRSAMASEVHGSIAEARKF